MTGMRTYYVYMLRCIDGTVYTGITNDVARRYAEHCAGDNAGCYTHSRRPLRLIYVGEFSRPEEAIAFEKRLKRWSHKKKRAFADRDWTLLKRLATPDTHVTPSPSTSLKTGSVEG